MKNLKIIFKPISEIKPYQGNTRLHSKQQITQIANSIKSFGFLNPIITDREGHIIAGHGRFEGAKMIGLKVVPTILAEHLTEAQKKAYALADNKIAENATWDKDLLKIELTHLLQIDDQIDISVTGFSTPEIDILVNPLADEMSDPPVPKVPMIPVSVTGDLWKLGRHRILCGDATKGESFEKLMAGEKARMVFADPPYNVSIEHHARGKKTSGHKNFQMVSGEMSQSEFRNFLNKSLSLSSRACRDGALHYVCMDWRHIDDLLAASQDVFSEFKNLCIWNKTNGGMGSFYRSKHELVFVFKSGGAPHVNNIELGKHGRNRTNVWDYPGVTSFGPDREENLAIHPTVKPLALVADAIQDASHRNEVVLDPFLGSGTTILAAEQMGRICFGIEIDPKYVDVCLERWWRFSGIEPVLKGVNLTCTEVKAERLSKDKPLEVSNASF